MKNHILSILAVLIMAVAPVSAATIFNSIDNPLPGSYPSQPFEAQQVDEFGDQVQFAGTDRKLTTVDVTMTNWACGNDFTWDGNAWVSNRGANPWTVEGTKQITFVLDGDVTPYTHDLIVTSTNGALSGNGGYPSGGPFGYAWDVTSGSVSGTAFSFDAVYTASADAVGAVMHVSGTIAADGSISGTWSDNYAGGARTGTWTMPAGSAGVTACTTTPGTGFTHPITLNLYAIDNTSGSAQPGAVLATQTMNAFIAFRPSYDPAGNCTAPASDVPFGGTYYDSVTGKCSHGYNTVITFNFSAANVTLPNSVIYGIAYNTRDYGAAPIGASGPYDSLNVGLSTNAPSVGVDSDANAAFIDTGYAGFYCDGGVGGIDSFRRDGDASCSWSPYVPAVTFSAVTPAIVKHDCSGRNDDKNKKGKQDKDCKEKEDKHDDKKEDKKDDKKDKRDDRKDDKKKDDNKNREKKSIRNYFERR